MFNVVFFSDSIQIDSEILFLSRSVKDTGKSYAKGKKEDTKQVKYSFLNIRRHPACWNYVVS